MKKLIFTILALGGLLVASSAFGSATTTIVQYLKMTKVTNAPCLKTDSSGLVQTTTCGAGTFTTTTINGLSTTGYTFTGSGITIATSAPGTLTFTNTGVLSNAGDWAGTWQLFNPSDFKSSSSASGITSLNGLTASTQTFSLSSRSDDAFVSSTGSNHLLDLPFMALNQRVAGQYMANPGATTINTQGFGATVVPTATGTAANSDAIFRTFPLIYYTSAATTSANAGWMSSAFTVTQANWNPFATFKFATDNTTTTNMRVWVGLTSANPNASSSPALNYAMFRYDTGVGDTNWMCMTKGGAGAGTLMDSGVAYAASSTPTFMIEITSSTTSGDRTSDFWIGDTKVCSTTSTPSSVGTGLGVVVNAQSLAPTAVAKKIGLSLIKLMSD